MRFKKNVALSESGFVFDSTTGDSFTINEVGLYITNLIKQEKSHDDILELMLQRYDIDSMTLEQNLLDFETMLRQFNLLDA